MAESDQICMVMIETITTRIYVRTSFHLKDIFTALHQPG